MSSYSSNITPDALSGMIFALEGVQNATVLLNGPTGCKYFHAAISDNRQIHQFEMDPLNYPVKWFFGQPRVPCTYLDRDDYVYGSDDKLTEALAYFAEHNASDVVCIVNSPGAALIGDDLEGIAARAMPGREVLTFATPGFSTGICDGFETAAIELLGKTEFDDEARIPKSSVNIIGTNLYQKNHAGDVLELTRLFEMCGIHVNAFLCGGASMAQIAQIPHAGANVVVYPEYGIRTAAWLQERFGMRSVVCERPPIGFEATQDMLLAVAKALGGAGDDKGEAGAGGGAGSNACANAGSQSDAAANDPLSPGGPIGAKDFVSIDPAIDQCRRARAWAYAHISRMNSIAGLPQGVPYAMEGTYSELIAGLEFATEYLGMFPVAISPTNTEADFAKAALEEKLRGLGFKDALGLDIAETLAAGDGCSSDDHIAPLVFANGNTLGALKLTGVRFSGIETALPTIGYIDVLPKTFLGIKGALMLVEMVLNGLDL